MFKAISKKIKRHKFVKKTMLYVNKHMHEQQAETFKLIVKEFDKIHKLDWETEFPLLFLTVILDKTINMKEIRVKYGQIKADSEAFFKEMDKIIMEI